MKRGSPTAMRGVFVLAMLIHGVALAHVHEGYVAGSVVVSPTSVAPGDTVNVQFAYQITHDPDTELVPSLWEVRLDADALNNNRFVGVLLADDTPTPTEFGTTTFNIDVDVVIPQATAIGTHTLDIFSAVWDFQPVSDFVWYVQQDLGLNQPLEITVGPQDTTDPVITGPADFTVYVNPGETGAVVDYVVTATDDSGSVGLVCIPASGSTFPVGDTLVICTATDTAGNDATHMFTVTVEVLGMQDIIDFFDASVADGTLVGASGNPVVAEYFLDVMRYVLELADFLIAEGYPDSAHFVLEYALAYAGGVETWWFVLVEGEAAPQLAAKIQAMLDSLE